MTILLFVMILVLAAYCARNCIRINARIDRLYDSELARIEQRVLSLLMGPDATPDWFEYLKAEHFSTTRHHVMFNAIRHCRERYNCADSVAVITHLNGKGLNDKCPPAYVRQTELVDADPEMFDAYRSYVMSKDY